MTTTVKRGIVAAVAVAVIGLAWLAADGTRPYLKGPAPVNVDIPRGARTLAIAMQLEDAGAIRSYWTFLGLHLLHPSDSLKAGEYAFDHPVSTLEVLRKIVHGDVSYQVLTVPEGSNRFEIADIVASEGFSTREEFVAATENPDVIVDLDPDAANLEGYLFPDSYHLPRHARPAEIVHTMVDRFRKVYTNLHPPGGAPAMREVVTIASLVEKETWLAEERPLIAGIFYNRLKRQIPLQADPTVAYATYLATGYTGRIRKSDLEMASPYNTYVNKGLPAGPITNPGKAALQAALRPAASDYMYFVARVDGGHNFSATLAEHNLAVEQYRQDRSDRLQQMREEAAAQKAAEQATRQGSAPVPQAVPQR
jgi:peptidoglycan lytic transglycosylase G